MLELRTVDVDVIQIYILNEVGQSMLSKGILISLT
jgi:hypothetical protein